MLSTQPAIGLVSLHRPNQVTGGIQAHLQQFQHLARQRSVRTLNVTPYSVPAAILYPAFGIRRLLRGPANAWWFEAANLAMLRVALSRTFKHNPFGIAYCQDPLSAKAALETKAANPSLRVVLAVHFNGSTADEWVGYGDIKKESRLYRKMQTRDDETIAKVDQLIFVSEYMRKQVTARVPAADRIPTAVVVNSASLPVQEDTLPTRDLITIGTLEPRKNHEFLLKVLAAANALNQTYTLTIVGSGRLRSQLEARVKELHLERQVRFLGAVPNAGPLISQHRAYVHSALTENMPIAVIEGLAAGRPVFAAGVGGIPEILTDGAEGRLWNLSDPVKSAEMLVAVLTNVGTYQAMSAAATHKYNAKFSPAATQEKLFTAVCGR